MAFSGSYSDASASSANLNQSGLKVGGDMYGRTSDLPAFLRAKMGGSSSADPGIPAGALVIAAAVLVAVLIYKRG